MNIHVSGIKKWLVAGMACLSSTLLLPSPCHGYNQSDCCSSDNSWGCGINVSADLLFYKTCFNDLEYGIAYDNSGAPPFNDAVAKYKSIDQGWEPGFRLRLEKEDFFCGWDLALVYTRVSGSDSNSTTPEAGNVVDSILLHPAFEPTNAYTSASSRHEFTYNLLQLMWGNSYCFRQHHYIRPFFGTQVLMLDRELKTSYTDAVGVNSANWDSELNAWGATIGTEYRYGLGGCLEYFAFGSGNLVFGDFDSKTNYSYESGPAAGSTIAFKTNDDTCVTGYRIGTGVTFKRDVCGMDVKLDVGVENVVWYGTPGPRYYRGDQGQSFTTAPTAHAADNHFGFRGVFARLNIGF